MPKKITQPAPEATGYAGFASLTAYIDNRMQRDGLGRAELSRLLGRTRTYISTICDHRDRAGHIKPPYYAPSAAMCDRIAEMFGDSPQIVRVLAGKALPPVGREASGLADKIAALPAAKRQLAETFVDFLLWQK